MARILGMNLSSTSPSTSFTTTNFPDLSGINNVFIQSDALCGQSTHMIQQKTDKRYILDVPINSVPYGQYYNYESQSEETDEFNGSGYLNLSTIDIKLFGPYGRILDLHGLPFNMTVKGFYDP